MTAAAAPRVFRGCDVCGQVDDHPRHVLGVPADWPGAVPDQTVVAELIRQASAAGADPDQLAFLLAEQADPTTVVRHPDCCAAVGCYDGSCQAMLTRHGGKTRQALIQALDAETRKLNGDDRDAVLATLPAQGLNPAGEQAARDQHRAALTDALADLDAADAAARKG